MSKPTSNPYHEAIVTISHAIMSTEWKLPYIHSVMNVIVNLFVLLVLFGLYCTIGVAAQIAVIFTKQIEVDRKHMVRKRGVEKSSHAIAIGIYAVVALPFWLVQIPFIIIAEIVDKLVRYSRLIFTEDENEDEIKRSAEFSRRDPKIDEL